MKAKSCEFRRDVIEMVEKEAASGNDLSQSAQSSRDDFGVIDNGLKAETMKTEDAAAVAKQAVNIDKIYRDCYHHFGSSLAPRLLLN